MVENWKTIEEFPDYEVSDLGQVRHAADAKPLAQCPLNKQDYRRVRLRKDGKSYNGYVHVLVAKAFVSVPPELTGLTGRKRQVSHKGAKADNRASQLEWRSSTGHGQDQAKRHQQGDGVYFDSRLNKWAAVYSPEAYMRKHLGFFSTYAEAKAVRDTAVDSMTIKLHIKDTTKEQRKS